MVYYSITPNKRMEFFTMLSTPLCLLLFFLCLKTVFSTSLHASSLSTTQLCSREEALALLQFKNSFSINSNSYASVYCTQPYSKTESWKEGVDCCSWDGVSCDNVTGHVTALDLSCNGLYGSFPSNSTIFLLKNLQSLNLTFNDFRLSKISPEIGQFARLKHLDISRSQFSGRVPREIAHLRKLVSLNLSSVFDSDSLDELIFETTTFRNLVHNLSEVRELELSRVNLASVNPRFFMNLSSSLTTLDLYDSELRGNFPNSILRFPNLKKFYLYGKESLTIDLQRSNWSSPLQYLALRATNCGRGLPEFIGDLKSLQLLFLSCNLEGSIPAFLGNLSQLTDLSLNSNNLSGQIPSSLASLTQLRVLDLSHNKISGQIPSSLANLTQLRVLYLPQNKISGQIPSSLANLTQLDSLDLSHNNISGQIPSSLANLTQLDILVLSDNNISGQIPSSLANLTFLDLSQNKISGQIPSSLANLTQLEFLDLSHNNISGPLPFHASRFSKLSRLTLSYNLLNGTMPPWIFTLPLLEVLQLNHNQLEGQINQFQQKSLEVLNLSNNKLQGLIPSSIANLVNLSYLDLSSNSIHGKIPEWICEKNNLRILDLSGNNLMGKIPNCLPRSHSVLNLQANNFGGNIRFGFPKGCGLKNLNLHGNQMDGLLPRSLVNCRMLEVLDVGNNNIRDTFPHWLESLPDLQVPDLRSNKFHGSVKRIKESPSFPKLRVLDLSNNDFLGPLPVRYMENVKAMMDLHADDDSPQYMEMETQGDNYQYSLVVTMKGFEYELEKILTIFTSIDLSNNKFEGEIPDVIGKLGYLKGLNLSHNNLTGPISPSIGNLTNVEWLDLSSNELVGEIPNELVSLTQLEVLNLSNNHLVGRIPQGYQFNTFENNSYEGNPGLCGKPLSKSCDGIGTPPSSFQEKDELWRFGWRVVVLGYGCGVAFGLLMGCHVFRIGKPKWFVSLFDGQSSKSRRKMRKARRLVQRRS